MENYVCPVCGKYHFEEVGDLDTCPFCGLMNDMLAEVSPDTISYAGFPISECKAVYAEDPEWWECICLLKYYEGMTN